MSDTSALPSSSLGTSLHPFCTSTEPSRTQQGHHCFVGKLNTGSAQGFFPLGRVALPLSLHTHYWENCWFVAHTHTPRCLIHAIYRIQHKRETSTKERSSSQYRPINMHKIYAEIVSQRQHRLHALANTLHLWYTMLHTFSLLIGHGSFTHTSHWAFLTLH